MFFIPFQGLPIGVGGFAWLCKLQKPLTLFSFGILLLEIISERKAIDVTYSGFSIVDWAIPLIKKGKLLAVYDRRIAPPKDPVAGRGDLP